MSVCYFEYFCVCRTYLFNTADIAYSNIVFGGRNYFFIDDSDENNVNTRVQRNQYRRTLNCKKCNHCIGGYTFGTVYDPGDHFRIVRHAIYSRRVFITYKSDEKKMVLDTEKYARVPLPRLMPGGDMEIPAPADPTEITIEY